MGLLDFENPQNMAVMQLAAGLLGGGSFGQALGRGLGGYQSSLQQSQEAQAIKAAREMQMSKMRQEEQSRQDALQREKARRDYLSSGEFNPVDALRSGLFSPEEIGKIAEVPNAGRQSIAGYEDVSGPSGEKLRVGLSKFGDRITGFQGYVPPQLVDQGNKKTFVTPTAGASFDIGMSPTERDASARGWTNINLDREKMAELRASGGKPAFNADAGGFIYPPSQQNPEGAIVKLPGFSKPPSEGQKKQLIGIQSLGSAIDEYTAQLGEWDKTKMLSPDARAAMGTKYNNMMLQAKEAYNLGVLNGPDYKILTSVIADPNSASSILMSKKAMESQANELKRIMQSTASAAKSGGTDAPAGKTIVKTGTYNGRKVVKYSDGSTSYAD